MSELAPLTRTYQVLVPAVVTAANETSTVCKAPFAGTVTAVSYVPDTAITGADTNTRKVALVNKGQSGAGSTQVASLQFNSGTNGVAFDESALALSGTPANLVVAEGDVLALASTAVGTGLADPGGTLFLEISRS